MAAPQPQSSQPKEDKPNGNIQLVVKALAMGGGGVGVLVASLFNNKDIPMLALGAVLGSAVAPIVSPSLKKLKQGAQSGGESIAESGESFLLTWKGKLSATERKYLEALQAHCYALECEGFSGLLPRLSLQDIFVPLKLTGRNTTQLEGASRIWSFLPSDSRPTLQPEEKRLAIIAKPGYGKTTLTRHLAYCFSSPNYETFKAKPLTPILLRFRDIYERIRSEQEPALEKLAVTMIQGLPKGKDIGMTEAWLREEKLKSGQCLVMLDGLDEVPEGTLVRPLRERVSRWAHYQMQRFPSIFILTSRPHGYNAGLFPTVRSLQILDFSNDQKRDFLEKWYQVERWQNKWDFLYKESLEKPDADRLTQQQARDQSQAEGLKAAKALYDQIIVNPAINQQLAINPLLLTIIAATHRAFDSLPDRRIALYRKMFGLLLEDRPKQRDTRLTIREAEQNQVILQKLASRLSQKGRTQFQLADAETWIGSTLTLMVPEESFSTHQFLAQIEQIAGLLVGGDSNLYEFAHKTFQEYLVAADIKEKESELPLIERLRQPDWKPVEDWKEIFSFYAALTRADFLVDEIEKMPKGEKRRNSLLMLKSIVLTEKSNLKTEKRQKLESWLSEIDLAGLDAEQVAELTLEQRFQNMIVIDADVSMTSEPITWGMYQQFLEAQTTGQFHSQASSQDIRPEQFAQPAEGLSKTDQGWFCAWLATQTSLQSGTELYDYRVPSQTQYQQPEIDHTEQFYIVRVRLDLCYKELSNLLANGAWKEADRETETLMLHVLGKDTRDFLTPKDLQEFPCSDLAHIDQLWVKNSGGVFGFTVQKKIWEECGSLMNYKYYNEASKKFGDRVGWRAKGNWLYYDALSPSLSSPRGILPYYAGWAPQGFWSADVIKIDYLKSLLSRPDL